MVFERASHTASQAAVRVRSALAAARGVDDWQIEWRDEHEAQLYLSDRQVEARRLVTNSRARVTIYNDHAPSSGGEEVARGASSITLTSAELTDPAHIAARVDEAIAMARLIDTRPFALPEQPAGGFPAVATCDPVLVDDLGSALETTRERLAAVMSGEGDVRLASAELYATSGHRTLENSRGLQGAYDESLIYADLVLVAGDDLDTAEFHVDLRRRRLEDLSLAALLPAHATFARDAVRAEAPATYRGPVVLSGWALPGLFSPLVVHSSARAAFLGLGRFQPGDNITAQPPRADHIGLTGDRLRPYGVRSAPFDGDGLPAARVSVVEDGVLRRLWGDARYATYAGIVPTGDFGNVSVGSGSTPLAALRAPHGGPLYEIVAFSWLRPDPRTGAFASEIKLGYRHEPGGASIPIKGGLLSGNLFTALEDACLSSERYSDGTYYGPAAIRFGELTISGGG
jgi:predicted Zn-dependent protease